MAKTLAEFEAEQLREGKQTEEQKAEVPASSTPPSAEGKEAVKEDVVIIGGKERSLKNYEAELKRKHEEDLARTRQEYESRFTQVQQTQQQTQQQPNYLDQIYTMAENEIATTGKAVPIQTIMQVANHLSYQNATNVFKTEKEANRTVNSFKRSLRSEPDWKEVEDEFDDLVEQLQPNQINAPTLEVILNSVRGKRIKDVVKRTRDEARKEAEKETEIVSSPVEVSASRSKPLSSLSPEQKKELEMMNSESSIAWTDEEYKSALLKKQNRFKDSGAKNTPQLLNDTMIQ